MGKVIPFSKKAVTSEEDAELEPMPPGFSARLEAHQALEPETFQVLEDYLEYRKKRHGCPDLEKPP